MHGTLYELRPRAGRLTHFYLTIALGGWIGGASVSIFAPHLFRGLSEYPILLFLFALPLFRCRYNSISGIRPDFSLFGLMRLALVVITFFVIGKVAFNAEVVKFLHRSLYGIYKIIEEGASIVSPLLEALNVFIVC